MSWASGLAGLAYPLIVWTGLTFMPPRSVSLMLFALVSIRVVVGKRVANTAGVTPHGRRLLAPLVLVSLILLISAATNDPTGVLLIPVFISAALLVSFAASLLRPPTVVEAIARIQTGELPPAEVPYCRFVTKVWCVFFVVNGTIAGSLAAIGTLEAWTLYCGLISYAMVGLLFAGERTYRAWRFRRYQGGPVDALLKRIFPADSEPEKPRDPHLQNPR